MANTKIIKQKIKSIGNIKKITKTMEMVSFAKMKKATEETNKISPYINEVKTLIERLSNNSQEESLLFKNKTSPNQEIIIIFASNKGLCGSFNSNIYKKTKKYIEENTQIKQAICLGKFAERIAKRLNLEIQESYLEIDKMQTLDFTKMEINFRNKFINNSYAKVHVVYTNFVKNGVYESVANCVYPLSKDISKYTRNLGVNKIPPNPRLEKGEQDKKTDSLYVYEPGVSAILNNLIPKLVSTILYSYLLESKASEHSMRSFAMKRAKDAAGEMQDALKLKYNKVRQDSVTQEIAEISAGANAG